VDRVTGPPRLGPWDLVVVYLRLLFVQGLLHRRGMQNLGLADALGPVSAKLDADGRNLLLSRHLSFFNCNPNFVPLIAGGILKLEQEKIEGKPVTDDDIERFKKALAGPVAAMGDMLFMGNLKALALTFGGLFAIHNFPIGLVAVFLLYNAAVLGCRLWGIFYGFGKGWELVTVLSGPRFRRILNVAEAASAGMGGALLGVLLHRAAGDSRAFAAPGIAAGAAIAAAAVTLYLLRKDVPASWIAIILLPTCAFIALLTG
jgi:PTS system mannose-specific IID component